MSIEFSLIIPTYNRAPALEMTLEHLTRVEFPSNRWEIVVVDDGSADLTQEVLKKHEGYLPLRWFTQANGGAGAARNRAIREAEGLFALFVDDDVLVPPELLRLHREAHGVYLRKLVRGPVINFDKLPPPPPPTQLWKHFSMNYLCTSNASLRRELLFEAGLFDESLERWEDAELGVRLKKIGVERIFDNSAYVLHYKPEESWESRCQTASRDGRSAALLYLRYPSLRMWLRSGLHRANELRNKMMLSMAGKLSKRRVDDLKLERIYLDSGRAALGESQPRGHQRA